MREEYRTNQEPTHYRATWRYREAEKWNERVEACDRVVEVEEGEIHSVVVRPANAV
jgi:hypothetical protein